MIHYIKGDLLKTDSPIIAHGVNIAGGFGGGVAGQIAKRWWWVKEAYQAWHRLGYWELGAVQDVPDLECRGPTILNCATQKHWLPRGKDLFEYDAWRLVCQRIAGHVAYPSSEGAPPLSVAMPQIGAGLAGGDWPRIRAILEEELADAPFDVRVYSL